MLQLRKEIVEKAAGGRSTKSQEVADLPIGARDGLRHHSATAKQQCPSSSTVARQFLLQYRAAFRPTR
jgi:hypothetical protein